MVGAIADWFAVTALFKHPLGLPIPHTALIPKRKDELGKGLEEFFGENFLQEAIIRERVGGRDDLAAARGVARQPDNARRVVDEVADVAVDRAGPGQGRAHRRAGRGGAGAAVPRGADRAAARHVRGRGGPRRPAPRRGRPGARGAAPLAGRQPRHVRRGAQRAGAVVGADPAQRGGHRADPHRGGALARRHPRRPAPPRPRGARLDAGAARARTCSSTPRPRSAPRRSRSGCSTTRSSRRPASRCGTRCAAALLQALRDPSGPLRERLLTRAGRVRRAAHHRRGAARPDRRTRRRRRGLRRRAVRRRADRGHHPHHRALGRQGGRPPDRAARRPRPPVHPDQRHHRRRPGRRADPHGRRWCSHDAMSEPIERPDPRRVDPARSVPQARQPGRVRREAKPLIAGGAVRVNGEVETRRGRQLVKGDVVTLGRPVGPGRRRVRARQPPLVRR